MPWTLYLDDLRPLPDLSWTLARSAAEARELVTRLGLPDLVSFDHDLGQTVPGVDDDSGYDFARWLVEQDEAGIHPWPETFDWAIHSANPAGARNIDQLMGRHWQRRKA